MFAKLYACFAITFSVNTDRVVCFVALASWSLFKLHNLIHVYAMLTLMITAITLGTQSTAAASGLATDTVFVCPYTRGLTVLRELESVSYLTSTNLLNVNR